MSELNVEERNWKATLRKLVPRILKATILTAIMGFFLLAVWMLISTFLTSYPSYLTLFAVFAWATLIFTFAIRATEGTIYKYVFVIARPLFLIIYLIYATNGGILAIDVMKFHFTAEFIPLLALMIFVNFVTVAKGMLEAIEFTSEVPNE